MKKGKIYNTSNLTNLSNGGLLPRFFQHQLTGFGFEGSGFVDLTKLPCLLAQHFGQVVSPELNLM